MLRSRVYDLDGCGQVHLGKIHEIASSHVSCRVLQLLNMLINWEMPLKQSLLMDLYLLSLSCLRFRRVGWAQLKERRLVDIIAKLNSSSEAYVSCVATDFRKRNNRSLLLTQGNCGTSAADVIQHVSSALLIRMIHTKDRSKIGILCIKHGSAQRDKNIKGMKDNISKIALDRFGSMGARVYSLYCYMWNILFSKEGLLRELQTVLKELILNKVMLLIVNFNVILEWKTPFVAASSYQCSLYIIQIVLSLFDSISNSSDAEGDEDMNDANETLKSAAGGKKDLALRRRELLVDSGLAEGSLFGKKDDILRNGSDNISSHIILIEWANN
ncbi:pumilio homolog 24 [Tanacetum coccineum]